MGEKRGMKALEAWCRRITDGYRDVRVENMTTAWRDGLAFCALIHHFRPDLIDFDSLNKENILHNNELAFSVAEKHLGIPALLEAEDMVKYKVPDKLSIMTYVSQFYQFFQGTPGQEKSICKTPKRPLEDQNSSTALSPDALPPKVIALRTPLSTPVRHDVCQACQHRVYILERLIIDSKLFHRTCFKCHRCQTVLKPGAYVEGPSPGLYECVSCPDEEEAEKAALASMAAARIAHISQSKAAEQPQNSTIDKPQTVKAEDMKITSAATKARKAFILDALNDTTPNDLLADISTQQKTDQSDTTSKALNKQSSYLLSKDDLDGTSHNKETDIYANDTVGNDSIVSANLENVSPYNSMKENEKPNNNIHSFKTEPLSPRKDDNALLIKKSEPSVGASVLAPVSLSESESMNKDCGKELPVAKLTEKSYFNDALIEDKIKDETHIDAVANETELPPKSTTVNKISPLSSPASSEIHISSKCLSKPTSRPLYSPSPTSSDNKNLLDKSPTRPPRLNPSPKVRRKLLDNAKNSENTTVKSGAESKLPPPQEISITTSVKVRPSSNIVTTPTSPNKQTFVVVHDMPIIKPKISGEFRRMSQIKGNDNEDKLDGSRAEIEKDQVKREPENSSDVQLQPKISTTSAGESTDKEEPLKFELTEDSKFGKANDSPAKSLESTKSAIAPVNPFEEDDDEEIHNDESSDTKIVEKELEMETKKKIPPPRPQPPVQRYSSLTLPCTRNEYPEDLNPFGEEDDDAKTTLSVSKSETQVRKSLNPFDSDEDDDDDDKNANEKVSEEPSDSKRRIPFGVPDSKEPEQPRTKIVPPEYINPFWSDGEEPESDEEVQLRNTPATYPRNSSQLSVKPVPLPRKSLENLNMNAASPETSNRNSGKAHLQVSSDVSPAVSPPGSLSKASGRYYSRDSGSDVSPSGSLSKASSLRKKRPAPLPPSPYKGDLEASRTKPSPVRRPQASPRAHKKSPAPPPPVAANRESLQQDKDILDTGFSEKTLKELDNMSMKSTQLEASTDTTPVSSPSNRLSPKDNIEKESAAKYRNTFGYWKKKKPAPPVPLPPKRQIKKIPLEEIQRELAEIEDQQLRLEKQGVEIEKTIRSFAAEEETTVEEEDLILQLFELVNEKNILFRRQAELVYLKRQQRLEEEHAELEFRIRCLMNKPDSMKTEEERQQEEELISHLMVVVEQRNEIIESMEIDRIREAQEDQSIQEKLAGQKVSSTRTSISSQGSATSLEKIHKKDKKSKKDKKEKIKIKGKSKEKEKSKSKDEDKDLDEVEVALKEKEKKDKKRKWF